MSRKTRLVIFVLLGLVAGGIAIVGVWKVRKQAMLRAALVDGNAAFERGDWETARSLLGRYVSANAASLASLDAFLRAPAVPASAVVQFRAFAQRQGVTIPAGAESDSLLQGVLTRAVAAAKWGDAGLYGTVAKLDPEVGEAVRSFAQAAALLGPRADR